MKVTRAGRQPCDPRYSRLAERIEALQAEIAALASELSVVSGSAGQAVVTAEDAQASAAASAAEAGTARTAAEAAAATAQGVSDRVTAAEAAIDDVQDYAEAIGDDVAALDTEIHTTRPYMTTNTEQTVTAKKHIPTATANDSSDVWVNKAFVQATDGRNNLVHNIGNETKTGDLSIVGMSECVAYGGALPSTSMRKCSVIRERDTNINILSRPVYREFPWISWLDGAGNVICTLNVVSYNDGTTHLKAEVLNSDGTYKRVNIADGTVI